MKQINNVMLDKMIDRVNNSTEQTEEFNNLLYLGEMLTKYSTLGIISGITNDSNKTRYSLLCEVVRADGIGDWSRILDSVLIGPNNHLLMLEMQSVVRELNNPESKGNFQYDSVSLLRDCLISIGEDVEPLQTKVSARMWFHYFARFRNKTRGHGAHKVELISKLCPNLKSSMCGILNNFSLFHLETVYMARNLSGKYRISPITKATDRLDYLKSSEGQRHNFENGVYLNLANPVKIDLIDTDFDLNDFLLPNGSFTKKTFEVISYITGIKDKRDNSGFLIPPNELPGSETDGLKSLEVLENCFTNIPKPQALYIPRWALEKEVEAIVENDRHPIVTLVGRGGIGKTTLALKILRDLCKKTRFNVILWFSARDIDLLEHGVKNVKPQVVGIDEIAKAFVRLIDVNKFSEKGFNAKKYVENQLHTSSLGPILVVIDNFETIENPSELFAWLDTHIRLPNKILITSRIKDSKGDYPITISGMTRNEFEALAWNSAKALKIEELITKDFIDKLFQESGGHPYITKIMLGEIAKDKTVGSVKRIAAGKEELLTALFERTFNMLSPGAKLVFLTLSSWRSIVPSVAVEAVLKTKSDEYYDIDDAIEELYNFSFVDKIKVGKEEDDFLFLPLAAHLFGQKKLSVSPFRRQIQDHVWYLNFFGVGHQNNISKGIHSKISLFFRNVASYLSSDIHSEIKDFVPVMEYLCHKFPYAWYTLSILYEENDLLVEAIEASQKYIQYSNSEDDKLEGWKRAAVLSRRAGLINEETHALVEICASEKCAFEFVRTTVKRVHELIRMKRLENSVERQALLTELIEIYRRRIEIEEGGPEDYVQLAWLLLNNQQFSDSKKIANKLLKTYPESDQVLKLAGKLKLT